MGQCMVVNAVFAPARGEVYAIDPNNAANHQPQSHAAPPVAPSQTVFEYLTPNSLMYLIQRGRSLLRTFRAFDDAEQTAPPTATASIHEALQHHNNAFMAASNRPESRHLTRASTVSPTMSVSDSIRTIESPVSVNISTLSTPQMAIDSSPPLLRRNLTNERPLSAYKQSFRSASSTPLTRTPAAETVEAQVAMDVSERLRHSMDVDMPDSARPRFPSVAASLASARNSPCPFVADKPDKLYLFLNQMSPDRVNQLATAFMLDAALVPHLFSHFLLHSTAYSSVSLEWVLGETALCRFLSTSIQNKRIVNRLYHMFARADPFGMQFGEFLMLMYSLSERATTEDKTWVAFKVCDFSNRLALGVPELKQLLVSVLELRQQSLSESDMEAIIKYTIAVGDHNHSGALEYLEFREMIFSQPDFLNLFTVQLAMLCPALDVVRALGPSPPTTKGVLNMSNVKPVEADHAAEASARKERPAYVDQVYARVRQQSTESSPALSTRSHRILSLDERPMSSRPASASLTSAIPLSLSKLHAHRLQPSTFSPSSDIESDAGSTSSHSSSTSTARHALSQIALGSNSTSRPSSQETGRLTSREATFEYFNSARKVPRARPSFIDDQEEAEKAAAVREKHAPMEVDSGGGDFQRFAAEHREQARRNAMKD